MARRKTSFGNLHSMRITYKMLNAEVQVTIMLMPPVAKKTNTTKNNIMFRIKCQH